MPTLTNSPPNINFQSMQIMPGSTNPLTPIPLGPSQGLNAYQNQFISNMYGMQTYPQIPYGSQIISTSGNYQYSYPKNIAGQNLGQALLNPMQQVTG